MDDEHLTLDDLPEYHDTTDAIYEGFRRVIETLRTSDNHNITTEDVGTAFTTLTLDAGKLMERQENDNDER